MNLKQTIRMRLFGFFKIPLLAYVHPIMEEITVDRCVLRIPLSRRTKNHLSSMYFGVLCTGADATVGALTMEVVGKSKISMVIKSFQSDFLRRPDSDVFFVCEDGPAIADLAEKAKQSGERENRDVHLRAETRKGETQVVAKFTVALSLKKMKSFK